MIILVTSERTSAAAIRSLEQALGLDLVICAADRSGSGSPALATPGEFAIDAVIAGSPDVVSAAERLATELESDGWSVGYRPSQIESTGPAGVGGETDPRRTTFRVDAVSRAGQHVPAAVLEVSCEGGFFEHGLSVGDDAEFQAVWSAAKVAIESSGVRHGPSTAMLARVDDDLVVTGLWQSLSQSAVPVDLAFVLSGLDHGQLLVEALVRPEEFDRRAARPIRPPVRTLGYADLRAHSAEVISGFDGFAVVRRLPGFHSCSSLPSAGHQPRVGERLGQVAFVHDDRDFVVHSLRTLRELEGSGTLFARGWQFVAYAAPRGSAASGIG